MEERDFLGLQLTLDLFKTNILLHNSKSIQSSIAGSELKTGIYQIPAQNPEHNTYRNFTHYTHIVVQVKIT